jgi:hypothetical protein
MKRFVNKVTVTGADDSVDPGDLIRLQKEYPFAEFGILLSRKAMGSDRFPSYGWIKELAGRDHGLNLAGHFCGGWVKEMYATGEVPDDLAMGYNEIFGLEFQRFQFNTHGYKHQSSPSNIKNLFGKWFNGYGIIFQYDDVNKHLLEYAQDVKSIDNQALFDLSHGAGVLPDEWPKPLPNVYCGYAGGLSPENVADNLALIEPLVGNRRIWIDAETWVRSFDDTKFDLDLVRDFLSASSEYVI